MGPGPLSPSRLVDPPKREKAGRGWRLWLSPLHQEGAIERREMHKFIESLPRTGPSPAKRASARPFCVRCRLFQFPPGPPGPCWLLRGARDTRAIRLRCLWVGSTLPAQNLSPRSSLKDERAPPLLRSNCSTAHTASRTARSLSHKTAVELGLKLKKELFRPKGHCRGEKRPAVLT